METSTQNFELFSAAIGRILSLELDCEVYNVYAERGIPFDKEELPAINITWLTNKQISEINAFNSRYEGTWVIECNCKSKEDYDINGDEKSKHNLTALIGKIRQILMNSKYRNLDFETHLINSRKISGMHRILPKQQDTENVSSGILEFMAIFDETTSTESGIPIGNLETTFKLYETDYGHKFIKEKL